MAANYEVCKEGWVFNGHRFRKGDPISLDAIERHGVGKTESFLRLGIIKERARYRHDAKYRKVRDEAGDPPLAPRGGKDVSDE